MGEGGGGGGYDTRQLLTMKHTICLPFVSGRDKFMFHGTKAGSELTDTERVCTRCGRGNYGPTSWNVCACVWRVGG